MPTILLAEDNQDNAETIIDYLKAHQYELLWAANGRLALEMARSQRPDLILMDIHMPEMDGVTAIQTLRADPALADLIIIAITALAMPGDRERVIAAGADDYFSKPLQLKNLLQRCNQYLDFQPRKIIRKEIKRSVENIDLAEQSIVEGKRPLILIVEDDEATCFAYEDIFTAKGYRVRTRQTGYEALQSALAEPPALILMDVQLPDINGLEVTRRLRGIPETQHIPIIILTGLTSMEAEQKSLAAGATIHLHKPISLWHLLDTVKKVLSANN